MHILGPLRTDMPAAARHTDGAAPIRVVLVDDCPEVRFLLATIIELDGRFDVVAEAQDADSALGSVATTEPDVVLVDLGLGADSGTSVIRELRRRGTTACIVVVSGSTAPDDQRAAYDAGADAMQSKCSMTSTMVDELADVVARHFLNAPVHRAPRNGIPRTGARSGTIRR